MKYLYLLIVPVILFADLSSVIKKAKEGDVGSITKLAYIYENGVGVKKDITKAKKLYEKAANLGNKDANLALTLLNLEESVGKSVSIKNSVKTSYHEFLLNDFTKSDVLDIISKAKKGDSDALYTLGLLYESGYGVVEQDRDKAIALYKKAYQKGSIKAKNILIQRDIELK